MEKPWKQLKVSGNFIAIEIGNKSQDSFLAMAEVVRPLSWGVRKPSEAETAAKQELPCGRDQLQQEREV